MNFKVGDLVLINLDELRRKLQEHNDFETTENMVSRCRLAKPSEIVRIVKDAYDNEVFHVHNQDIFFYPEELIPVTAEQEKLE